MKPPKLRLVNVHTGELQGDDILKENEYVKAQLKGAESEIRRLRLLIARLETSKEAQARSSVLWPVAKELFELWKVKCKHPRSKWAAERYFECESMLKLYGRVTCEKAIEGASFDPYTTRRKNGSTHRHDNWDLIFRSPSKVEDFANRAPRQSSADRNGASAGSDRARPHRDVSRSASAEEAPAREQPRIHTD